jgi:two-component system, NarL family, response regulator DesR
VPEPRIAIVGGGGALATEALAWLLTERGNRVVGAFADHPALTRFLATEGSADTEGIALDAVIVDAEDPSAGPAAVAEIRDAHPELKILLLCEAPSPAVLRCAIEEGVEGLLLQSDPVEEAVLTLRHVLEGRAVMPAGWQAASRQAIGLLGALSGREREVLELAASGMSNREIAERLIISANTVKFHLRTIYTRLGVHNRVQATQALCG